MAVPGTTTGDSQDQGDSNPPEPSTVEEIFDEEFDRAATGDDEDGDDEEPGADESNDGGDQSDDAGARGNEPTAGQPGEPPARKWGGQFNTPEEMEAAYIAGLQRPAAATTTTTPTVPDLNDGELRTLAEQDESDKTNFLQEYLVRKMQTRNLQPHELVALRKFDMEKGTDLQGDYYEMRAARRIARDTLPLTRASQEESVRQFQAREQSINESNRSEFGERLQDVEKFCSNAKNVEQVLQRSPIAHIILSEDGRGSKATAHKLLLREADTMLRSSRERTRVEKRRRSVPADIGGEGGPRKSGNPATVEECFEEAERELSLDEE